MMSKGLEALKEIKRDYKYPSQYEEELFETIEKQLKALEIIKNKQVAVDEFIMCIKKADNSLEEYNAFAGSNALTKEEYELLKEVMLWD